MNRQTVLVVFGGESSEHDVSIMSARNVYAAISKEKYSVLLVYIDRGGAWWLLDDWHEDLGSHKGSKVALLPGFGLYNLEENKVINVDVAFPVMHGENGHEDGTIQGALALAHIPVIGSGIEASAVCWDKLLTKQQLAANGIQVTPFFVYRDGQALPEYDRLAEDLGEIVFVKPTTAGSSVGVSRVASADELKAAVKVALKNSDTLLIEKAIVGRELEVAILGTPPHHRASGVGEIIPGEEFYSYDDKYAENSKAQVLSSADVPEDLRRKLQDAAREVFALLGCKGLARVDFLVDESNEVYVNEINTLPGFTNISQYPRLWQESGISYAGLIDELIADALG